MDATGSTSGTTHRVSRSRLAYPTFVAAIAAVATAWAAIPIPHGSHADAASMAETGAFPSLLLVRRLLELLVDTAPAGFPASFWPGGLALAALAAALFVWARRFDPVRGGAFLLLAVMLPVLSIPAVASAILGYPQLGVSFLAGTLVLSVLGGRMERPSDLGLLACAFCLLGAWVLDDLFWASLPGCLVFLLARSPEAIRSRSLAAVAVIVLFPVLASAFSALFLSCIYVYPETGITFATGFEAFDGAVRRLAIDAPSVLPAALVVALGLNFALAALAPSRLAAAFAVCALPFSACLIGMGIAGADGLLAALPMVALSILETLRVIAAREANGVRPIGEAGLEAAG